MKQVLRESLWLLSGGQYLSFLDDRESIVEIDLTYSHFSQLRPQYSASSWRGAMLKAQERGWVHKRLRSGKSTFQLTKTGREVVAADFQPFRQFLGSNKNVSLLAFKPIGSTKTDSSSVRAWLVEAGGVSIAPGLWAFPSSMIPEWVITRLKKSGFLTLPLLAAKSGSQKSLDLFAWIHDKNKSEHLKTISFLEESSKSISLLLNLIESKKTLHHLQISQIGGVLTHIYSEVLKVSWLELEDDFLLEAVFQALQMCDQLLTAWILHGEAQ